MNADRAEALDALQAIDPNCDRDTWLKVGMGAIAAGVPVDDLVEWSAPAGNYGGERDVRATFRSVKPEGGITSNTLFKIAREAGWKGTEQRPRASKHESATAVWNASYPAKLDHAYVVHKNGVVDDVRMVSLDSKFTVAGRPVAGWLMVPGKTLDGSMLTAQYISPHGDKLTHPGRMESAMFVVGEISADTVVYITEGYGQASTAWRATGKPSVCAFGWHRVKTVAKAIRETYPNAQLVLVPDAGKEAEARKLAADIGAQWIELPADLAANTDINDLAQRDGADVVEALLAAPHSAVPADDAETEDAGPLDYVLASDLSDDLDPEDQILEGVLGRGTTSVMFGDSNAGKTFVTLDIANALAREADWMGRRTVGGLVVYLATENPGSVKLRQQAYQRHHQVRVRNLAIVKSPINLFNGDDDPAKIVDQVKRLEAMLQIKCVLIIGDTLARMSVGAKENTEDMGVVMEHAEHIVRETGAHFMLIHHCGKDQAKGMRGWSGMRAHIDTEIEVTADDATGERVAEITKQRDLPTKGDRIGFRLRPVDMGIGQWGKPRSSCVVEPASAPAKASKGKRPSEVAGALKETLRSHGTGMRKSDLAKLLEENHSYRRTSVYREITKLVDDGQLNEAAGMVSLSKSHLANWVVNA